MKRLILKPGFETIFALSMIVILGLPPILMAQNEKEVEISIKNGDTIVNGKKLNELSANERMFALKDIKKITGTMNQNRDSTMAEPGKHFFMRKYRDTLNKTDRNVEITESFNNRTKTTAFGQNFYRGMAYNEGRKNTLRFDYENTDNEGIRTHIRFFVSDASNDDLKRMPYVEGGKFEMGNLVIAPEFSNGNTLLMFTLPAKTEAEVKLFNSASKIIWTENASGGSFKKEFNLGLNGVYYLQVKQGNLFSVKRIIKEE